MSIKGILLTRLCSEGFITHAALPMPPQRRHFFVQIAIGLLLHLLISIVNFFILPNYRMINLDSIFNLSSGVTCNWCI